MRPSIPDFNAESPLDKLSASRLSLNSTGSRQSAYILDAFPISPDINSVANQESQPNEQAPANSNEVDFDWGLQPRQPRQRLIDLLQFDSSHQYSAPPGPVRPAHHGPSRSWDGALQPYGTSKMLGAGSAGGRSVSERSHQSGHHASVTLPQQSVVGMSWTPEQRIQLGAAAIDVNPPMALAHWRISADEGHRVAPMLYELACSQWGKNPKQVNFEALSAVNAPDIQRHVPQSLLPRVSQALFNLGIGELKSHNELRALRSYELAGELGSPEGMCAAASMYMRGGKHFPRDVVKARELYTKAGVK